MTHLRQRTLTSLIKAACAWSPAIAVMGMRQTGKTTLLAGLGKSFYSLDEMSTVSRFQTEGQSLLDEGPYPLVIDEAQKFPPLFDALKAVIDRKKSPGRFLLTGSVRFSSRKAIRESLTGRIATFELFPLSMAECHSQKIISLLDILKEPSKNPEKILRALEKRAWANEASVKKYIETGGLPGICFRRETAVRERLFDGHLDTLLGRDISLVREIRLPIFRLKELFTLLCLEQGLNINFSRLAKLMGVSAPTIRKTIDAMEGLFLIRRHGVTYYAEDLGLSSYACRLKHLTERQDMLRFLHAELRANLSYANPLESELSSYQTRGGVDLPFVIRARKGLSIAIAVDSSVSATEKSLKGLTWFQKKNRNSLGLVVHRGEQGLVSSTGMICIPWTWIP